MVVANITCGKLDNKKLSTNKSNELSLPDTTLGLTYLSVGKKQKLAKKGDTTRFQGSSILLLSRFYDIRTKLC